MVTPCGRTIVARGAAGRVSPPRPGETFRADAASEEGGARIVRAVTRFVMPFRIPAAARAALAALAVLLVLLPAVAAPVLAADATVHIRDGGLDPMRLVVAPGTTVTWVNDASDRHRMRSHSGPTEFDSGNLEPGES